MIVTGVAARSGHPVLSVLHTPLSNGREIILSPHAEDNREILVTGYGQAHKT